MSKKSKFFEDIKVTLKYITRYLKLKFHAHTSMGLNPLKIFAKFYEFNSVLYQTLGLME